MGPLPVYDEVYAKNCCSEFIWTANFICSDTGINYESVSAISLFVIVVI